MVERLTEERREGPSETPPIVIKIGGSTLRKQNTVVEDISSLYHDGRLLIVVHGGGPDIDAELRIRRINIDRINGVRVTDEKVLGVVIETLSKVNEEFVEKLLEAGINAVGVGKEVRLLKADRYDPKLGFVGKVRKVNKPFLQEKMEQGVVPVISPIAFSMRNGSIQLLNANSDMAAGSIAAAFPGSRLLILTDKKGVLGRHGLVIENIDPKRYEYLKEAKVVIGGMIPKIDACFEALNSGSIPQIIDGERPHAILDALEGKKVGTSFREG